MYKLKLSPHHAHILKEAFISFYFIRQNCWREFVEDIETYNDTTSLYEEAYKTACPDYEKIYVLEKNDKDEIIDIKGVSENFKTVYLKVFRNEMTFENTDELRVLLYVVEEYMRMRMGQFFIFVDDVAENGWKYDNTDPDNDKKFNEYIKRRNKAEDMFNNAYKKTLRLEHTKTKKVLIAEDMYDVLKHQIWLDTPSMHNSYNTWSCPPLNWSGYKMPKIEVTEK